MSKIKKFFKHFSILERIWFFLVLIMIFVLFLSFYLKGFWLKKTLPKKSETHKYIQPNFGLEKEFLCCNQFKFV